MPQTSLNWQAPDMHVGRVGGFVKHERDFKVSSDVRPLSQSVGLGQRPASMLNPNGLSNGLNQSIQTDYGQPLYHHPMNPSWISVGLPSLPPPPPRTPLSAPPPPHNATTDQDLRFSADDLILSMHLVNKSPELLDSISDLVEGIGEGVKGRHELQFFFQSRGDPLKSSEQQSPPLSPYSSQLQLHQQQTIPCQQQTIQHDEHGASQQSIISQEDYGGTHSSHEDSGPIGLADSQIGSQIDDYNVSDSNLSNGGQSSSNTGIRGITWQESRCSYQASVCISLKQIYKIFSAKRVGKDRALEQARKWLAEMRTRRDNGESLESLMKAGLFARKVSNTGIRGITWQESRMKFQCSIYMEKGRRVQKYFPTGLNRSGPRYEEAFRKAKEWTRKMEMKKRLMMQQSSSIAHPDGQFEYSALGPPMPPPLQNSIIQHPMNQPSLGQPQMQLPTIQQSTLSQHGLQMGPLQQLQNTFTNQHELNTNNIYY
eukprot:GHVH01007278.1.p1 GENE.GHVH01007278.1~~GHVH01007278.1.p1  ORF type:complete len:484 (-),score=47.75 GHVH01007278.1:86-1537(-)